MLHTCPVQPTADESCTPLGARAAGAWAMALGMSLWSLGARAQSPASPGSLELRVSYEAPAECPSGSEFLAALQAHLAEGGDGAVDVQVHINAMRDGRFELRLEQRVEGNLTESHASAGSCATLVRLAALNASIARTPGDMAITPAAYTPAPGPTAIVPGLPSGDSALASPRSADRALGLDAPVANAGAAGDASEPSVLSGFALAELRAATGMFPHATWGQGLALGVALEPWSLRASVTLWQPESFVYTGDGSSALDVRFEQQSLELMPCWGQRLTPLLRLEGCASLSAQHTRTEPGESQLWGALAGSALAVLQPWRGLRVEAAALVQVPLSAPRYAVETLEDVYHARRVQPGLRLAIGWEFGSRAAPATPPATIEMPTRLQAVQVP